MKTDFEIAHGIKLAPITTIAENINIPTEFLEPYGKYVAKVPYTLIDEEKVKKSNLILVTSITPTKYGNGKTTMSIGLALGMNRIGKNTVLALREPSLGPCFGMKGGATGGGYAQVLPLEKINLHLTGDFHAVTTANNMIAALLDNYIYQHQDEGFRLKKVLWKRVLDINDRSLRDIVTGLGGPSNGIVAESGFNISNRAIGTNWIVRDCERINKWLEGRAWLPERNSHIVVSAVLDIKIVWTSNHGKELSIFIVHTHKCRTRCTKVYVGLFYLVFENFFCLFLQYRIDGSINFEPAANI